MRSNTRQAIERLFQLKDWGTKINYPELALHCTGEIELVREPCVKGWDMDEPDTDYEKVIFFLVGSGKRTELFSFYDETGRISKDAAKLVKEMVLQEAHAYVGSRMTWSNRQNPRMILALQILETEMDRLKIR